MTMVFDRYTQNSKAMHTDCSVLHSSLILENVVDWLREEANEGIPLGCSDEYPCQLQLENLAHLIECCL